MINYDRFRKADFQLGVLGFQPRTIVEWNSTLREAYANNLKIVEFIPQSQQNGHWRLLLESKLEGLEEEEIDDVYLSNNLNSCFKRIYSTEKDNGAEYLKSLLSSVKLTGFYIPVDDIERVESSTLKEYLIFYQFHLKYFPYTDFLISLSIARLEFAENENNVSEVIWLYVYYYSRFLHHLKEEFIDVYNIYGNWFSDHLDLDDFHRRLPSEQITILLLKRCEEIVANSDNQRLENCSFTIGSPAVNSFFEHYNSELMLLFDKTALEENSALLLRTGYGIMDEFAVLFSTDHDELFLQEVLDNHSELGLHNSLPLYLQLKYGPSSIYNVSNIVKDKIFSSDDLAAGQFKEDDQELPNCRTNKHILYPHNVQLWYDILPEERSTIIELVLSKSSNQILDKCKESVTERCRLHWINLINLISSPVFVWNIDSGNLIPQWNVFEKYKAVELRKVYQQSIREIAKEKLLLDEHLEAIIRFESKHDLDSYLNVHNPKFHFEEYHLRWEGELDRLRVRIRNKEKYYESRMREFGICDIDIDPSNSIIWLKELLQIEEEVKPYIRFVKEAFQTALPIRNQISFSNERHANDGIEFYPNTLFDQEKWIRADVMKVLESKIKVGEAIQINAFCLDYSGSMNHDRMRNLFKIICLLVLGLEDRKSHDAFHFFSNNFIEGVNFSSDFTNRSMLFQILEQIAELEFGKVKFRGKGATNISGGIEKCHNKLIDFVSNYRIIYPKTNIVTSMFVITDGEPSLGITDLKMLNEFIEKKRNGGEVAIKGVYIKSEEIVSPYFMKTIFGDGNYVQATNFKDGVENFVKILTNTYKSQRKEYKWKQKKRKLGISE